MRGMALGVIVLMLFVSSGEVHALPVPSDAIAYWSFDEGEGATVHDGIGNNDGTIHGASWVPGLSGWGLRFDGQDDFVEVPNDNSLSISGPFTIEVWVMGYEPAEGIRNQVLVAKDDGACHRTGKTSHLGTGENRPL